MTDAKRQLDYLIRATYPVIGIASHEEARVQDAIIEVVRAQKIRTAGSNGQVVTARKTVWSWTYSSGLVQVDGEPYAVVPNPEETAEPVAALRYILNWNANTKTKPDLAPAVFVFKDLDCFLGDYPLIGRLLRDISESFKHCWHTLVLLSPSFNLPQRLEKSVTLLDWPLPGPDELDAIIQDAIDNPVDGVEIYLNDTTRHTLVQALRGLTANDATDVLCLATTITRRLDESAIAFVIGEKAEIIRKSKILEYFPAQVSMDEVGGHDLLKTYIRRRLAGFSAEAQAYRLDKPRGVLIFGVPGTGKSLVAKVVAQVGQMPLVRNDIGAVMGGIVGESESNARKVFKTIRSIGPCVVWIDEADKGFSGVSGYDGDLLMTVGMRLLDEAGAVTRARRCGQTA